MKTLIYGRLVRSTMSQEIITDIISGLTAKERLVYIALLEICNDYDSDQAWTQLLGNYCDSLDGKTISGVCSQLSQKGLVICDNQWGYEEATITVVALLDNEDLIGNVDINSL